MKKQEDIIITKEIITIKKGKVLVEKVFERNIQTNTIDIEKIRTKHETEAKAKYGNNYVSLQFHTKSKNKVI